MKKLSLAVLLVCAVSFPLFAAPKKANVKVMNNSDWAIHHMYLSPVSEDDWGPDQLGKLVIDSEGVFTLKGIPCDSYDVKVVDEDGDECIIEDVDICGGGYEWEITNDDLLACEGYGD